MMSATSSGPSAGPEVALVGREQLAPAHRRPVPCATTVRHRGPDLRRGPRCRARSTPRHAAGSGRARAGPAGPAAGRPPRPPCGWPCRRPATRAARRCPMSSADPVARPTPVLPQAAGESVGARVPLAQRELGAVGQVPPRHGVGERAGQLGQQLGLEQRHADAPVGASVGGAALQDAARVVHQHRGDVLLADAACPHGREHLVGDVRPTPVVWMRPSSSVGTSRRSTWRRARARSARRSHGRTEPRHGVDPLLERDAGQAEVVEAEIRAVVDQAAGGSRC